MFFVRARTCEVPQSNTMIFLYKVRVSPPLWARQRVAEALQPGQLPLPRPKGSNLDSLGENQKVFFTKFVSVRRG